MKKIYIYCALFISNFVCAQDFEVSPGRVDFNAEPGENQTKSIIIKNHSNKKMGVILAPMDYLISKEGKTEYLDANTVRNSIANWITLSPAYAEIQPNQEVIVNITLQAPLDDYSSKWGVITVTPASERQAFSVDEGRLSAGVGVGGRIIIKVYQSPGSNQNHKVKINNLKEITEQNDTTRIFEANIDNIGDKITDCKVFLIAANLTTAEEVQFNPLNILTFPKTSRIIQLNLPFNALPNGKYSLSAIVDYGSHTALEGTQIIISVPYKFK